MLVGAEVVEQGVLRSVFAVLELGAEVDEQDALRYPCCSASPVRVAPRHQPLLSAAAAVWSGVWCRCLPS